MGLTQTVICASESPTWEAVRALLAEHQYPLQLRMIDGELAFPEEQPPAAWREIRVGTPQGMITVRRLGTQVELITWGNATGELLQAWNALTWAFAAAGNGQVQTEQGPRTANDYRHEADLPPPLKEHL